jgi:hypothetical protein
VTSIGLSDEATAITAEPEVVGDPARGWYFYGITRRGSLDAALAAEADGAEQTNAGAIAPNDAAPVQLLEFSELAAVVRAVSLADFTPAALRERLQDASVLETMVRNHNRVIEAIHAQQAILPAKFGTVHARAEDFVFALRPAHDSLLQQLARLDECDEWAVHVYADRAAVRERVAIGDEAIRRLREERAVARPGRAYFLEQQLRDAVEIATERALSAHAQSIFDELAVGAVDAQVNPIGAADDLATEPEILRASFLVRRDSVVEFTDAVRSCADSAEGLRGEYSGPWPPYSFAARVDEEAE